MTVKFLKKKSKDDHESRRIIEFYIEKIFEVTFRKKIYGDPL
jgi:hypothetical protein